MKEVRVRFGRSKSKPLGRMISLMEPLASATSSKIIHRGNITGHNVDRFDIISVINIIRFIITGIIFHKATVVEVHSE